MTRRWGEVLAARIMRAQLPINSATKADWYWSVAERAMKPLLPALRALRVPERVRSQIEYAAEDAIRSALGDDRARRALLAELVELALRTAAGKPGAGLDRRVELLAKKHIAAWRGRRIELGLAKAKKEIAAGERETKALLAKVAAMDARRLHGFADRWNWDDGTFAVDAVVRHPRCSLGTALLVYWLAKPFWHTQWKTARSSDDPEIFEMLAYIEARIAKGGYAHAGIAFDPRRERLTSVTYDDEPKRRKLPAHVFAATTKTGVVSFEPTKV